MASSKSHINLLRGWPNPALLPSELLKSAADHVLSDRSIAVPGMLYGPDWGDQKLRKALAQWLTGFYTPPESINTDRLTITGGASQNLACILQTFTDPIYTRTIFIVVPAYMLAFRIFDDSGFGKKLRAVPEDEEGLQIEYLRAAIEKSEREAESNGNNEPAFKSPRPWSKTYKHIIYAVPTFSNPSSKTMTLKRREQLVRIARDYDALVVTDDVYDQLQWPARQDTKDSVLMKAVVPRLVDVDRTLEGGAERAGSDGFGNVASNGSFSKICGPGVRTGWVEGTNKFSYGVSQTGSSRSGGAPSHLVATFMANLLETGRLQRHISQHLQPAYARRFNIMMTAIQSHLVPLGIQLPQTDRSIVGGYFIWIQLPAQINAQLLAHRAKESVNLIVAEGALFEVPGDTAHASCNFHHELRLCFAWEDEEKLEEGIVRLAGVIESMQSEGEDTDPGVTREVATQAEESQDRQVKAFW